MKHTFLVGAGIAVAFAGLEIAGGFDRWERLSVDMRWLLPRADRPLSDEIIHVDIDDGAIDHVGRWPWDRSTQADLIDEINRSGARTIAIDVQWTEVDKDKPLDDARLAHSLSNVNCVLAVAIKSSEPEALYHAAWLEPTGRIDLQNLMEQLALDIWLEPEAALDAARVTDPERRARYLRQPLEFKRAAAWGALQRATDPVTTFDQLERLVAPQKDDRVERYTERETLKVAWRQFHAWRILRQVMLRGESQGTWNDQAPLPIFAQHADMVGYVNVEQQWDSDGIVRQLDMMIGAEGGFVLPFGVAAAARHLDLGPADIIIEDDEIFFGSARRLPLHDNRLWIDWPTSDTNPRWLGLMRRDPADPPDIGHISARTLLSLAEDRRSHMANRADFAQLTRSVLGWSEWGHPLSDQNREKVREWAEFQLGVQPGAAPTENKIDAEKHRATEAAESEQQKTEDHERIDLYAQWLSIDAMPAAEQTPRRREWTELALDILLGSEPIEFSKESVTKTRAEVERALADSSSDPVLRERCSLWKEFDTLVGVGEQALLAREAELQSLLGGKLVFIGYLATGITDLVPTPIDPSTPGVVAHAVVANTVLDDRAVRFLPAWLTPLVVIAVGLICSLCAVRLSPLPSGAATLAILVGYFGAGWALFASRTLAIPFITPAIAGALCWTITMTIQAASTRRERQRITRQFKARASGQLVEHLVTHPHKLSVSGEEREVAVLFADLANFTSISEALGGELAVATLNKYMTSLVDVLVKNGAYVNKFLGDGVMAFWSAFQVDPQQAKKACQAAVDCQAAVAKLNKQAVAAGQPEIGLRLGLATGRAVVGDCGAPPAINDYTVIGDVVNLAARLESANKQFGTSTLINERTFELINGTDVPARHLGRVVVVGQSTPTTIFEVLPPGSPPELIELTQRVVEAFGAGKFDEAKEALDELEKRCGSSGMVDVYRDAIANVRGVFDGVLYLRSK